MVYLEALIIFKRIILTQHYILGGLMSCRPGNKLEGELKDWVEGAKDGVIYVSFGSVVKAHEMPEER